MHFCLIFLMDMEDTVVLEIVGGIQKDASSSKYKIQSCSHPPHPLHFYLFLDPERLYPSRLLAMWYFIFHTRREFLQWLEKLANPHFQKSRAVSCRLSEINRTSQNVSVMDVSLQICHCCNFLKGILKRKPSLIAKTIFHYEIFQVYIKVQKIIKGKPLYSPPCMSNQT